RRRRGGLSRGRWRDLVPWWGFASYLALLGLAVLQTLAALLAHPWAASVVRGLRVVDTPPAGPPGGGGDGVPLAIDRQTADQVLDRSGDWLVLAGAVVGLAAVLAVVWLAVLRPAETDPEVDAALRTRSARVAVGVGIGLALGL